MKLLAGLDAFRNPDRVEPFILACEADAQGRGVQAIMPYRSASLLRTYLTAVTALNLRDLADSTLDPRARGQEVQRRRLSTIRTVKTAWPDSDTGC